MFRFLIIKTAERNALGHHLVLASIELARLVLRCKIRAVLNSHLFHKCLGTRFARLFAYGKASHVNVVALRVKHFVFYSPQKLASQLLWSRALSPLRLTKYEIDSRLHSQTV